VHKRTAIGWIKKASPETAEAVKRGEKTIPQAKRELGLDKPRPNGQTKLNGHVTDDPPDIAKNRAKGKIPAGNEVEVTEPDETTSVDAVREEIEEQTAMTDDALGDEDWLATLPLTTKLTGAQLKTFQTDALAYRTLEKPRKAFAHHASRTFKAAKRKGAYLWRVKLFLGIDHPAKWLLCPSTENGGCGGSGQVKLIGQCPKCNGRGYWLNS
jgi:hypothetical protein